RADLRHRGHGRPQAGRVRPYADLPLPRRPGKSRASMTGPKLNEAPVRVSGRRRVRVQEETTSFRAKARYMRVSAYKVREALDLIRGLDAERARETLRLSERDAATVVDKVLASAIANGEHHHEHPVSPEEL